MTDTQLWIQFVQALIARVGAPASAVSVDTFWAWAQAETAPFPLLRWNNPMNTTEPWPGARDSGAQPGAHDVKIYASLEDGIAATAWTLLNEPYYPNIVANLRAGIPRQRWGATSAAGAQLHAWGTGTNWLTATYPPAPTVYAFTAAGEELAKPKNRSWAVIEGHSDIEQGFVRGKDLALYRYKVANKTWTKIGGTLSSPRITGFAQGQAIDLQVTGSDGTLWNLHSDTAGETWVDSGTAAGAFFASGGSVNPGDDPMEFVGPSPSGTAAASFDLSPVIAMEQAEQAQLAAVKSELDATKAEVDEAQARVDRDLAA